MKSFYNSPNKDSTSIRSETNFKNLKPLVPHPLDVQKFILKDKKRNPKVKSGILKLEEEKQLKGCSASLFEIDLDNLRTLVVIRYDIR